MGDVVMRVILIALLAAPLLAGGAEALPSASNVLARVIARAQQTAGATETNHYVYEKRSVTTELDEKDLVIKSNEKLYRVKLVGGLPFPRLVKIHGRELTAKELEKEDERELAFRQRMTRVDMKKKSRMKEGLVTTDLVERFDFTVTGRDTVEGRPTLIVKFAPRANAPDKSMEDKIFKHVRGTIWVDEAEGELTKLDANLAGPLPLGWFGAIGSLHHFQATVERARLPDGVWVNRKSFFHIVARKLFSAIRLKTIEESSGFRRE